MNVDLPEYSWFAVHVRSNQEKIAEALLREKGVPTFLPLRRERSRRRDKILDLELPLFPGYLFCRFAPENRAPIVTVNPVVRVVGIGRTPVPVEPGELDAVRAIVGAGVDYAPWPYLNIGEQVRLVAGPLCGLTGILLSERGEDRVVVSVGLIQRSVATEVKRTWIAPVRPRSQGTPLRAPQAKAVSVARS